MWLRTSIESLRYLGCNADNVLRALRNPTRAAGASVFCSGYLQSTLTVTTVIPSTSAITKTETTATTTTTTALTTAPTTTTVTCAAAPTSPPTCGFAAYGFSTYLISQTDSTDPTTCHEYCLANPNCKSFQVQLGGASYCNLYNAATAGNVQAAPGDQYYFYDRNCPDYLPVRATFLPSATQRESHELMLLRSPNAPLHQQRRRELTRVVSRLS